MTLESNQKLFSSSFPESIVLGNKCRLWKTKFGFIGAFIVGALTASWTDAHVSQNDFSSLPLSRQSSSFFTSTDAIYFDPITSGNKHQPAYDNKRGIPATDTIEDSILSVASVAALPAKDAKDGLAQDQMNSSTAIFLNGSTETKSDFELSQESSAQRQAPAHSRRLSDVIPIETNPIGLYGPNFDVDTSDVMSIGSIQPENSLGDLMGPNHHVEFEGDVLNIKTSGENANTLGDKMGPQHNISYNDSVLSIDTNPSGLLGPDFDWNASDVMSIGSIEPQNKLGNLMGPYHHIEYDGDVLRVKTSGENNFTPVPTRCLATKAGIDCSSDPTSTPQRTVEPEAPAPDGTHVQAHPEDGSENQAPAPSEVDVGDGGDWELPFIPIKNPNEAPWWSSSPRSNISDDSWSNASDTDTLGSDHETDIFDPDEIAPHLVNPNDAHEDPPHTLNPNEGTLMPLLPAMPSIPSSTLPLPVMPGALPTMISPMGASWMMNPGGLPIGGLPVGGFGSLIAPTTLLGGIGTVSGPGGGAVGAGGTVVGAAGGVGGALGGISIGGLGGLFDSLVGQGAENMPKSPDIETPSSPRKPTSTDAPSSPSAKSPTEAPTSAPPPDSRTKTSTPTKTPENSPTSPTPTPTPPKKTARPTLEDPTESPSPSKSKTEHPTPTATPTPTTTATPTPTLTPAPTPASNTSTMYPPENVTRPPSLTPTPTPKPTSNNSEPVLGNNTIYPPANMTRAPSILGNNTAYPPENVTRAPSILGNNTAYSPVHMTRAPTRTPNITLVPISNITAPGNKTTPRPTPTPKPSPTPTSPLNINSVVSRTKSYIAGIRSDLSNTTYCTGALIAPNYVLTSDLCKADTSYVSIGTIKRSDLNDNGQHRKVVQSISHPKYNPATREYDFLVLQLETASTKTPVTLLSASQQPDSYGQIGQVLGWNSDDDDMTRIELLSTPMVFMNQTKCTTAMGSKVYNTQTCAYGYTPTSACHINDGSPLVASVKGKDVLVGLVSYRNGCTQLGAPTLFSLTSSVRDWIKLIAKV